MNLRINKWMKETLICEQEIINLPSTVSYGRLVGFNGAILEVSGLQLPVGSVCFIENSENMHSIDEIEAEVVGFKNEILFLMLLQNINSIIPGSRVRPKMSGGMNFMVHRLPIYEGLLGRILDSTGKPLDGLKEIDKKHQKSLSHSIFNPLHRHPVSDVLDTGIRAINALLTIGRGQRIGLFSSSGLGKSVLLGMMTKYTAADIVVLGLIGERGREVKEFIETILTKESLKKSVIIASPAEFSPLFQVQGANYAVRIAEYFRDKNFHVLLIMDSLTRYAMAHREIALSIGELPAIKGYPPSVFSKISSLIERAGNGKERSGSITAFYTVLTEEEEKYDPIADSSRSILDGHIILSREYAESSHYPAINIETSISRVMSNIVDSVHNTKACYFKKLLSCYQRNRDLINVGAYVSGTNSELDIAITLLPRLTKFLQQGMQEKSSFSESKRDLYKLFS
ncbi:FliI/YscN family ATPase [Buchnera aphidicola]|uniref:Flagellum-specific ATP synthase n=1 Tax=Buchnera aphidicola subsp. Melaphis rhois TaxID=118103 RepID=A0A4D6Y3K0_BUCMH|nr:FliI/YscN family ATPase [Buchnera aphidicola]QCI23559.1 FliI/YscN family ATPase [Buchnera aphidicola (Melaphis rhois)]